MNWWVFALRGLLALVFGLFAFLMPAAAMLAMTIVFAAYALVDGGLLIAAGVRHENQRWWALILTGILSIVAGLVVIVTPVLATFAVMAFLWAALSLWAIATGVAELYAAIQLRREIHGEWLLALNGIASIVLGIAVPVLLLADPLASLIALGVLAGTYAIVSGAALLALAWKFRRQTIESTTIAMAI